MKGESPKKHEWETIALESWFIIHSVSRGTDPSFVSQRCIENLLNNTQD